jgi:CheY-like chemotaxis protein
MPIYTLPYMCLLFPPETFIYHKPYYMHMYFSVNEPEKVSVMSDKHNCVRDEHHSANLILVIEDDENIGEIIVQTVQSETSYQAVCVPDSSQALELVQDLKPQLFLIDYRLPGMNGLELYDHLHSKKEFQTTPAVLMSANAPAQELRKRDLYYLKKPFELDELLQVIDRFVG